MTLILSGGVQIFVHLFLDLAVGGRRVLLDVQVADEDA
jgi:hypothetical protein